MICSTFVNASANLKQNPNEGSRPKKRKMSESQIQNEQSKKATTINSVVR